jgi:1-acyl-sn-glycerol-3-phosphate acyltransferase
VELNVLAAFSFTLVRRYLSWSVAFKATRLVRLAKAYVGFRIYIEDEITQRLDPPFILVANHQSLADIVILLAAFRHLPIRFVAKAELRSGFPGVSPVLRYQRHALIDRHGNFREAIATLRRLAKRSCSGLCPVVFPEGTRSRTGQVGRFYAGAVKTIHAECRMPVTCVALDGGRQFVTYGDIIHGVRGAVYRVKVMSVSHPKTSELGGVLDGCRDEIAKQLEQWSAE